jgi:hypothetical protein
MDKRRRGELEEAKSAHIKKKNECKDRWKVKRITLLFSAAGKNETVSV